MTTLELFEKQIGRLHTIQDWQRTRARVNDDPTSITDLDVAIVQHFEGPRQAAAIEALRTKALTPPPVPPAPVPRRRGVLFTNEIAEAMADAMGEALKLACEPLHTRIKTLEQRLEALDGTPARTDVAAKSFGTPSAKPRICFRGAWEPQKVYGQDSGVVFDGKLWRAVRATTSAPADGDSGWELAA